MQVIQNNFNHIATKYGFTYLVFLRLCVISIKSNPILLKILNNMFVYKTYKEKKDRR